MTVTLTSPVLGQDVGSTYTGDLEPWLLAQGYAKRADYTGPGVSNTGPASDDLTQDPREPENREDEARWPAEDATNVTIANDADNLNKSKFPAPANADFDEGGVDDDAPANLALEPDSGPVAGGTEVTLVADNLEGATGVTFGGVAGTAFELAEDGNSATVVTPPHAAGAVDVAVTGDVAGAGETLTGGFTYTA